MAALVQNANTEIESLSAIVAVNLACPRYCAVEIITAMIDNLIIHNKKIVQTIVRGPESATDPVCPDSWGNWVWVDCGECRAALSGPVSGCWLINTRHKLHFRLSTNPYLGCWLVCLLVFIDLIRSR